jgi:hypothetical protein
MEARHNEASQPGHLRPYRFDEAGDLLFVNSAELE